MAITVYFENLSSGMKARLDPGYRSFISYELTDDTSINIGHIRDTLNDGSVSANEGKLAGTQSLLNK